MQKMHLKDCIEFYMCAYRITFELYTMCTQGGGHEEKEKKIANMHERMSAALFEKSTIEIRGRAKYASKIEHKKHVLASYYTI